LNERIEADIEDLKEYTNAQDFVNEKEEQAESIKRDLETYGLHCSELRKKGISKLTVSL